MQLDFDSLARMWAVLDVLAELPIFVGAPDNHLSLVGQHAAVMLSTRHIHYEMFAKHKRN